VHKTLHEFHTHFPRTLPEISHAKIREDLCNIFDKKWDNAEHNLSSLGLTRAQIESFRDESKRMLINFTDWFFRNNMALPELSEARMFSRNLGLAGIIDAVHTRDDKVTLVDYKTSRHAKITDDIRRQAALYALLYHDKNKTLPDQIWVHFLKFPGDPLQIKIDDQLVNYAKFLVNSVREDTKSDDEQDYPCTCGGYCEMDFID
jgi:ATP-dependent exoDNAse (exonuclease V) beta subunit